MTTNTNINATIPFLDPPACLSLGQLRKILDTASIDFGVTSPFGFLLLPSKSILTDAADGGHEEPVSQTFDGSSLVTSLRVLAQPDARIRLSLLRPDAKPALLNVFITGHLATYAFFDRAAFYVSRAMPVREFAKILSGQLGAAKPFSNESPSYLDFHIKLLNILWPRSSISPKRSIASPKAISILTQVGLSRHGAVQCLRSLTAANCLVESDDAFSLPPTVQYWMSLLWSGYCMEVERKILRNGGVQALSRNSSQLTFIGPPGRRCLCHGARAVDVFAEVGALGDPALAPLRNRAFISFRHVDSDGAMSLLTHFFRYVSDSPGQHPSFLAPDPAQNEAQVSDSRVQVGQTAPAACLRCGKPLVEGKLFCTHCALPTDAVKCPKCGSVTQGREYCTACGQPMKESSAAGVASP
jgi:hypothetical protein